jgi:alginate O-acetyltransferase complex protein AlgI
MLFQSLPFLCFFLCVFVALAFAQGRHTQVLILLAASTFFYITWNPACAALLLFCVGSNYFTAIRIGASQERNSKKIWLLFACIVNIGLLIFFKYYNFFISSVNSLLTKEGGQPFLNSLEIILPVGISFYTFISLGYVIDVYRGTCLPEKNFFRVALLPSFFPVILSGPILRASEFLSQLRSPVEPNKKNITVGTHLFLQGLVKKVLVADQIAPLSNFIFGNPQGLPSAVVLIGAFTFGVQIYCDFSGYTDMALGVGRALGYQLPTNFQYPYMASSFSAFWRRWHISLSNWLRDYVYIPLGGNKKGAGRTYYNLMATMALCGLWHGASWNFILWGIYHGVLLSAERMFGFNKNSTAPKGVLGEEPFILRVLRSVKSWAALLIVQYFVFLGWMIFKVKNIDDIVYCAKKYMLFDFNFNIASLGLGNTNFFLVAFTLAVFFTAHVVSYRYGSFAQKLDVIPLRLRMTAYVGIAFALIILWPTENVSFIYFQF